MSKTGRDVDLILFLRGEADAGPFARVRRADPDVNGDVQRFAFDNATELGLRVRQLIVKAAKSSPGRNGVVVLKESVFDAEVCEFCVMVSFKECAARVPMDYGA